MENKNTMSSLHLDVYCYKMKFNNNDQLKVSQQKVNVLHQENNPRNIEFPLIRRHSSFIHYENDWIIDI